MTALAQAQSAYARPDAPGRSPRTLEYELLARVTRQLSAAWAGRQTDRGALIRALHDNLTLWRTLAADVAEDGNGLPPELRARLFYLYEFAGQHSRKVLDGAAEAAVLIEINTAVMRGLRGETSR
jgi:flagellar protein FlaF